MPIKDPTRRAEYLRAYRAAHRERLYATERERKRRQQKEFTARLAAIKQERGCERCGAHPEAAELHFHHRDPATKEHKVSSMSARAWALVETEIAKCDVLCERCHIEVHAP